MVSLRQLDRFGGPKDSSFTMVQFGESLSAEVQCFEPALPLEIKRQRGRLQAHQGRHWSLVLRDDGCIVVGEWSGMRAGNELCCAIDSLPVVITIDGASDQQVAASVHIFQQRLPPFFGAGLR